MRICYLLDSCFSSSARRWVTFVVVIIELFWFSGVHYGFNALIPALNNQSVFSELSCNSECPSYAFIVSLLVQMCLIPVAGLIMDKVGLRLNKLIGTGLMFFGLLAFGFTDRYTSALYFVAMSVVSYASLSNLICSHQISGMFPAHREIVLSMLNGAYDSSTAVFFILSKTYPNIPLRTSFILLAFGALVLGTFVALFLLKQYSRDMNHNFADDLSLELDEADPKNKLSDKTQFAPLESKTMEITLARFPTMKSCFQSLPFVLVCLWFMLGLLRFSYFLSQLEAQLNFAFQSNEITVDQLLETSSAMSMSGFVISPLSGLIMYCSRKYYAHKLHRAFLNSPGKINPEQIYWTGLGGFVPATIVMATAATLMSALLFVRYQIWVYYVAFICHMFLRSLLFSTTATMVISAFPITYYGTVYGVVNLVGGLFSTLQYGMLKLPLEVANGLCVAVSVVMFVPPVFIWFKNRSRVLSS